MGIAQFIASTARLWRVDNPFNPADAIEKSAAYLAERRRVTPLAPPSPWFSPWGVQVAFGNDARSARAAYDLLRPACRKAGPVSRLQIVPHSRGARARSIIAWDRRGQPIPGDPHLPRDFRCGLYLPRIWELITLAGPVGSLRRGYLSSKDGRHAPRSRPRSV